ncbi:MAG TPA: hypothetical protein PLO89_02575 [Spirochaetota bacterium]|nr:hypothetical protein [Spirochaetota bacterium]
MMEKFIESEEIDFNNVKKINFITKNKRLGDALEYFFIESYKNRALSLPFTSFFESERDGLSNELNIRVDEFDYGIKSGFRAEEKNAAFCWKTISAKYKISIFKSGLSEKKFDLTGEVDFTVEKYFSINLFSTEEEKQASYVNLQAQKEIKKIDNYNLFYGAINKIFRYFLQRKLIPLSRELISFKTGLTPDIIKSHKLISEGKMDEALILWEQIYSDKDNSYYSRSIAAFNIGTYKAVIEKDFVSAEIYFRRYDELEEDRAKDFIGF